MKKMTILPLDHHGGHKIGVGIGERMSGKEFGEYQKFKMAARG